MRQADAIILPQGCRHDLYQAARDNCAHVFPNYDKRYHYQGKTGQSRLFQEMEANHPLSHVFPSLDHCPQNQQPPLPYPFVFKLAWGGEGQHVHLVTGAEEWQGCLAKAALFEQQGHFGFVCQQLVDTGGRSLRVVVIDQNFYSYWRCGAQADSFYTNIAKGATIDHQADSHLQQRAITALRGFCRQSAINLAGFDFLFQQGEEEPFFLEINYCFRTKGLGGSDAYQRLLSAGVQQWLTRLKQDQGSADLSTSKALDKPRPECY